MGKKASEKLTLKELPNKKETGRSKITIAQYWHAPSVFQLVN